MVRCVHYGPVELRDGSLWGSDVNPRNAEKMLMATNTKDVWVDNAHRCHKWGLCSSAPVTSGTSGLKRQFVQGLSASPLLFLSTEKAMLEGQKVTFMYTE